MRANQGAIADRWLAMSKAKFNAEKMPFDTTMMILSTVNFSDDQGMTYPGGKGRMRQLIIPMMPPHRVYIETYLGGGAVMRAKRPASVNISIDIDPSVTAAWRAFPYRTHQRGCSRMSRYL